MTTINAKLEKGHWVATESDVETLAHDRYANAVAVSGADGTYLRVLLVAAQAELGRPRGRAAARVNTEAQLAVLGRAHERFYAAVLRGIVTPDVAIEPDLPADEQRRRSLERNARSAFARTAMHALVRYVEAGGDLRTLEAANTTKTALRAAVAPPEPTDKVQRQITRAEGALLRAVRRQVRDNPDNARHTLERLLAEFQKALDDLEPEVEEEPAATMVTRRSIADRGPQRTRVGVPQLHRGAT